MILVLNCGSQSVKWKLFDDKLKVEKEGKEEIVNSKSYQKNLEKELKKLDKFRDKIKIVGHRVVYGGKKFRTPIKVNGKILKELEKFNRLAPLHNPFNILGIRTAKKNFVGIPHIAVFDTEFYINLPEKTRIYPLPSEIRKKYGIQRFGFHGISHEYAAKTGAKETKKPFRKLKIITCHLGGGSSITAIKNGRAVDTSMGFTPMEGLTMMTRCGDIDPGIILELARNFSFKKIGGILNYDSGIKGISGIGNMLEILKRAEKGNKKARLALEIFVYKIQKYVGAYFAILGGCDLLIFTGTIGFGSAEIRKMATRMPILKKVKILAVTPDEELMIAKKLMKF
jgi:acetate kinase